MEAKLLHDHLPEEIQVKRVALGAEERRIANYVGFIGEGKGTRALGEALKAAEEKALALRAVLQAYEASEKEVFKASPVEWVAARLMALQAVLEAEPSKSALELRRVLGRIRLIPVQPQIGKPYYQAETLTELHLSLFLLDTRPLFIYQQVAEKAHELSHLGMSASAIAKMLKISDKTVTKALRHYESRPKGAEPST